MKILVAEDDQVALAVIRQALVHLGHEVVAAEDGRAAWGLLQEQPLRLVVSDWDMPREDGLELCRRIRARTDAFAFFREKSTKLDEHGKWQERVDYFTGMGKKDPCDWEAVIAALGKWLKGT